MSNADNPNNSKNSNRKLPARGNKANRKTAAARYNVRALRGLESLLLKDPEADLVAALSAAYSARLRTLKSLGPPSSTDTPPDPSWPPNDVRRRLQEDLPARTIFPLSVEVQALLDGYESTAKAMMNLLRHSELLFSSPWAAAITVFRVSDSIAVKASYEDYSKIEHQTLTFLQENKPDFPAPRPHGLICLGPHSFLFTSYVPGMDLEKAWPRLDSAQKENVAGQLELLLSDIRSIPFPKGTPLGSVYGGGCRDLRQTLHAPKEPIMSVSEFHDFIFGYTETATPVYTGVLRGLMPESTVVVFTHGDLRPANIMMRQEDDGTWRVAALIDWESSGFYPDYWEAVKATNLFLPGGKFDWYNFMPKSASPAQYAIQWLVDRVWDRNAMKL